jgi:GT2 family glycosyltransferase
VSWNTLDLLRECVDSLRAQTRAPVEVVVVDNGSTDGSVEWLAAQEDVDLIQAGRNLGFAAGNNLGLRRCHGDLVLLLNADVRLAPDYLQRCSRHFLRAEVGSVTGKLIRADGNILDSTGHRVYGLGWAENRGEMLPDLGYDQDEEVFGVSAAAALYRLDALASVAVAGEVFDESYFSYIEDVDLDWRLRWLGWQAWFEPAAIAVHHRSATGARFSARIMRHILKNRILTVVKNYDSRSLVWNLPGLTLFTITKTVDFGRVHPTAALGLWDAARGLGRAIRWRRELGRRRRAAPADMQRWLQPFPWRARFTRRRHRV